MYVQHGLAFCFYSKLAATIVVSDTMTYHKVNFMTAAGAFDFGGPDVGEKTVLQDNKACRNILPNAPWSAIGC